MQSASELQNNKDNGNRNNPSLLQFEDEPRQEKKKNNPCSFLLPKTKKMKQQKMFSIFLFSSRGARKSRRVSLTRNARN